jgi:hypothetical protein
MHDIDRHYNIDHTWHFWQRTDGEWSRKAILSIKMWRERGAGGRKKPARYRNDCEMDDSPSISCALLLFSQQARLPAASSSSSRLPFYWNFSGSFTRHQKDPNKICD